MSDKPKLELILNKDHPDFKKEQLVKVATKEEVNQQLVDNELANQLRKYEGQKVTPYLCRKIEKEARRFLLQARQRKLISFRDVSVKFTGDGRVEVTYDR